MYLIANSVDPNSVREEQRNGDRYLIVEDVPFVRSMDLAGGYVPEAEIEASVDGWSGRALTANHPRNDPQKPWYRPELEDHAPVPVTASEALQREHVVGEAEGPYHDGTWIRADFAVNADVATAMGGDAATIVEKIENGEPFDVSSQYVPKPLPPGEYDGAQRANVEGIERPDSIALLPTKPGTCSIEDGCGINPQVVANAGGDVQVRVPATDDPDGEGEDHGPDTSMTDGLTANVSVGGISFEGTATGTLEEGDLPNDPEEFASHYVFDADTKGESSFPLVDAENRLRRGNVAAAFRFRDDAPDLQQLLDVLEAVNDRFDDPPIDPESLDEATTANADGTGVIGNVLSFLGVGGSDDEGDEQPGNEPAEPGADPANTMDQDERARLIAEITANTEIEEESLEGMGDACLEVTHENIVGNAGDGGSDDPDDPDDPGDDPDDPTVDDDTIQLTENELDERIEERAREIVETEQTKAEKAERVDRIIANSAEYDEEDREELLKAPARALDGIESTLDQAPLVPAGGATANTDVGGDDEIDTEDVSSGVL